MFNNNNELVKSQVEKVLKSKLISQLLILSSYKRRIAFTLAEVLITLLIIGVIASLTIPVVTRKIQDAQFKVALKKTYSELVQGFDMMAADHDGSLKGICPSWDEDCAKAIFTKYFKHIKSCAYGQSFDNCFVNENKIKMLDGTPGTSWWGNKPGLVLVSGSSVIFEWDSSDCSRTVSYNVPYCSVVTVDINGFNQPNVVGKDIYIFLVRDDTVKPVGLKEDAFYGTCNTSDSGWGCAAKNLYE